MVSQHILCKKNWTVKSYAEVLASTSEAHGTTRSDLSQMVHESLFNISKRSPEKEEPRTVSWKDVVDELQGSLGSEFDVSKGTEYDAYRVTAKQHWDSKTSCYQKAATAYSNRSPEYAAYLSEQAKVKAKLAREAEEKASQEIFRARNKNKGIENDVMTTDLHGQHVKQALKLLKIHLLYGKKCAIASTPQGYHRLWCRKVESEAICHQSCPERRY
ncbi:hypothetical protein M0R45_024729 [Rubus argutus]|uniref:DUF1771 domain-containing protein n=1 Tax=Rubus argutus TaxID=59490 RepID=A0AAW1WSD2_RUBAR